MTNIRTYKSTLLSTGQSGSYNLSGSSEQRVWGILRNNAASGSLSLEGGGVISISDLNAGVPFPCYPISVNVITGSVYVLS